MFIAITVSQVNIALKQLDITETAGPDNFESCLLVFFKLADDIIALPLIHLFNLFLVSNEIL